MVEFIENIGTIVFLYRRQRFPGYWKYKEEISNGRIQISQCKEKPNFEEFKRIIKGEKMAEKVHLVELLMDYEIKNISQKSISGKPGLIIRKEVKLII